MEEDNQDRADSSFYPHFPCFSVTTNALWRLDQLQSKAVGFDMLNQPCPTMNTLPNLKERQLNKMTKSFPHRFFKLAMQCPSYFIASPKGVLRT
ncbi:MAG: hypothetical protein KC418_02135 [Anaerolineales bacterium]|nr:hypothetical protein [Anaerolineales bacterium]MCB8953487.1 hypothetical protein [Ardenticatenales bacterium]